MPNRNGTGPEGLGPLSGRRMGMCAEAGAAQNRGRNFACRGMRQRYRFFSPTSMKQCSEKEDLLEQKNFYEQKLSQINDSLNKL